MNKPKMTETDVFNQLVKVIEQLMQVFRQKDMRQRPKIELTTDIYDDLGIDSLEVMDLIAAIEKAFCVSLNVEEVATKRRISEIVEHVSKKLAEGK